MADVLVHGLTRSVYTRIVRLALLEKGVPHRLNEVEIFGPEGVPPEHLARHPFGRIPVLEHAGVSLYETAAITRYVDEAFAGPPLQPAGVLERARMNQLIGLLDGYAYRPMVWGLFVEQRRAAPDAATVASATAEARRALQAIEQLSACSPWLLGGSICLADLHAWPMLTYLALVPAGQSLLGGFPRLAAWQARLAERPSVRSTQGPYETGA